jgi:uncharacterized protein DUF1488
VPLQRSHDSQARATNQTGIAVEFTMTDGETAVLCRVTDDALDARAAHDGFSETPFETFLRCRHEIEEIVRQRYAVGQLCPLVLCSDLVPFLPFEDR